jgi:thiosulfate dehydrogenase (quinone) large subunit
MWVVTVPPRTRQVGWVLLPLRGFIAAVFVYGGIYKIADKRFLDAGSRQSMHASVLAVRQTSPIGGLLGPVVDHSFLFGLLMALAELAVGLGVVLGLWTRLAAAGGMLLAVSLWLTVSWGARPWFTSADLVYLFAFTPLLIAGAGGVLSIDGWLATVAASRPGRGEDRTRRALLTAAAGIGGLVVLAAASLFRRSATQEATQRAAEPVPSGTAAELVKAADVPVGGGKQVDDAVSGDPTWVLQLSSGDFTAYDATCPHQGCAVNFVSPSDGFACPCHGSQFTAAGALVSGPARRGLTAVPVAVADGIVRRA